VDPSATVSAEALIGPGCVVGAHAAIDAGAVLIGQCWVGSEARVGQKTVLHPGVRLLDRCRVGSHCIIHANVVIGADGFGFHPSPDGRGLMKVPHVGDVVIDDHVEIGANSCIDRAKFGSTSIGAGTKIDNLVQIGHNTRIGRACIICGQAGLSGSVTVGDGVMIGGGVGIADNLTIGSGAKIGARSGVGGNIAAGESYFGYPAEPASQWRRNYSAYRALGRMLPQLRRYIKTFDNPI
jgi:UDP-3-O-[3-hydroxymyristoyl] glucosamine N-acyltransferase